MDLALIALETILDMSMDVLPIVVFIVFFQVVVLKKAIARPREMAVGFVFVAVGLGLFLVGLEQALFPLGEAMAIQLTHALIDPNSSAEVASREWHTYLLVYLFAFSIGFASALAEPALLAVALKARELSGGAISVIGLRVAVAVGAAIGVTLGCVRIVLGIPIHHIVIVGYLIVTVQTLFAPKLMVPLAFDSGGVTTSTVTVPLIAALGLGLAETIKGRSPLLDGFGMVAITCLCPIITVLAYSQLSILRQARSA